MKDNGSTKQQDYTLVATGAALFVLLSVNLTQNNGDVTRIVGQVVTGIGFLGAGIIFKEGLNILGLTTGAALHYINQVILHEDSNS